MSMFSHSRHIRPGVAATVRRSRRSRAAVLTTLGSFSLVISSVGISGVGAQTTRVAAVVAAPHTNQFCTFAENASKASASSATAATETPASLAATYAKLKQEELAIVTATPSQIKGDFTTLFNFANKFYAELASVKYNFFKLPHTFLLSLATYAKPVGAASKAITAYLAKNCGLKTKG